MLFQVIDKFNINLSGNRGCEVSEDYGTGGEIYLGVTALLLEKCNAWPMDLCTCTVVSEVYNS
jgi:hypothetical protein